MKCIFCPNEFDPQKVSPEHIIPKNIGGTVVTYQVCGKCNTIFSKIDAELNRNRNIYDAYVSIQEKTKALEFRFFESYVDFEHDTKVKTIPKSSSKKIVTTKIRDDEFICDRDCDEQNDPVIGHMKKIAKQEKIPIQILNAHLEKYNHFKLNTDKKEDFKDDLFRITAFHESSTGQEMNLMNAKPPHRFVAKACVEFAHLMEFSHEIVNIDLIRMHSLEGGLEGKKLHFHQEDTGRKNGLLCHLICFTEKQFQIHFFSKFGVALDIEWRARPVSLIVANDCVEKKFLYCQETDNGVVKTDKSVSIKMHEKLGLRTNI